MSAPAPARIAILSDIHANLEALDAVLADMDALQPTEVACLGDFVGYGASPNECLARLRPRLHTSVLGNHDAAALGQLRLGGFHNDAATTARWTQEHLEPDHRAWLESLPMTVQWRGLRLVHASPSEPDEWHYVLSIADADVEFEAFDETACLIGHSHVPGSFWRNGGRSRYTRQPAIELRDDARYLVNVGSVGQPRDGDPRAAYAIVDEATGRLEHRRVEYDVERAAARILEAGLPRFLAERLQWGE